MRSAESRMPSKSSNSSRVAVDVAFEDFPVVGSRKSRLAGVADGDAALRASLSSISRASRSMPSGAKVNAGGGAVERRIVILKPGGHANHGGFDVRGDGDELALVVAISHQTIKRADARDGQRGRSAQAGAGRSLAVRGQMKSGGWFEEVDQLRDQFQTLFTNRGLRSPRARFQRRLCDRATRARCGRRRASRCGNAPAAKSRN